MKNRKAFTLEEALFLFTLPVIIFALLGWVFNIIALASMNFDKITGEHIIRIVGIFMAPIGSVAGWLL